MSNNQSLVRVSYNDFPGTKLTSQEIALRERFDAGLNQLTAQYMQQSQLQDVLSIELFPCSDECADCKES